MFLKEKKIEKQPLKNPLTKMSLKTQMFGPLKCSEYFTGITLFALKQRWQQLYNEESTL